MQDNDIQTKPPELIQRLEKLSGVKFNKLVPAEFHQAFSYYEFKNVYTMAEGKLVGLILSRIKLGAHDFNAFRELRYLRFSDVNANFEGLAKHTPALEKLHFAGSGPNDLTIFASWSYLTYLGLTRLQLEDCSPLASLTALNALDLVGNQILDCSPLASLTALNELFLVSNQIQDCSPLASLTALNVLSLGFNQIQDCSPLASLTALNNLDLCSNQIQDCSPLASLTALNVLHLGGNQIQDCSPLASLTTLNTLYLGDNQIQDCSPLASLTALNTLDLNGNQIQDCRPLASLIRADLSFCWMDHFYNVNGINPYGNPLTHPPVEIAARGHKAIMAWLAAQQEPQRELCEAKVLLVGAGGAGKTSLVKRLLGQVFDPHQSQTHGIAVAPWTPSCAGRTLKVNLWDFGGQEIMYATHQFFLTQRSLYLLVLDSRKEEGLEDAWLRMIQSFGGDAPIIVVLTKADENRAYDVNRRELSAHYPAIAAFQRISNASGEGIEELKALMLDQLAKLELVSTSWPETWFQVKSHLETMAEPYVSYNHYDALCGQHQLQAQDQRKTLLQYLNDLGTVLHFPDLEWLDTQVLKPNWVTAPIYALINHPDLAKTFGELDLNQVRHLLPDFPTERVPYLRELMKRFELCHPLDKSNTLLLPALLPVGEPHLPLTPAATDLHLRFSYRYLPHSLIERLMVRHYHLIHTDADQRTQWRTGALFHHVGLDSYALAKVDHPNRRLDLRFSGSGRHDLLLIFRKTLLELHASFQRIEATEWVCCICDECQAAIDPERYQLAQLKKLKDKGKRTCQCRQSGDDLLIEQILDATFVRVETEEHLADLLGHSILADDQNQFTQRATWFAHSLDLPATVSTSRAIRLAWQRKQQPDPARPAIAWLHLSDIHYTLEQGWRSDQVLAHLAADAQAKLAELKVQPALLFATGDLGLGQGRSELTLKDQIAATLRSLVDLADRLGIPRENIFVIPGNHDVNRKRQGPAAAACLKDLTAEGGCQEVEQMLASQDLAQKDDRWPLLRIALDDYFSAVAEELPHLYQAATAQGVYAHQRQVAGQTIGIFGFNGAWSCGPHEQKGNLWLGSGWQRAAAINALANCDLRIGLIHHPPAWFQEAEQQQLRHLDQALDILLHGHEHDAWVTASHYLTIAAGACFASTTPELGYNLTVIDPTSGQGTVHLRDYHPRGWKTHEIPDLAPKGAWPIEVKRRKAQSPPSP